MPSQTLEHSITFPKNSSTTLYFCANSFLTFSSGSAAHTSRAGQTSASPHGTSQH